MAISVEEQKKNCAYAAVDALVVSDTVIGLGTGSTAKYAVDRVAEKLKSGALKNIRAVPTSEATADQARSLGIALITLDDLQPNEKLSVSIDGADEISDSVHINLVKGRGAALLREKMVELQSTRLCIIADESKLTWIKTGKEGLGHDGQMPVEVTPFCCEHTMRLLLTPPNEKKHWTPAKASFRMKENERLVTDNRNYIIDLFYAEPISEVTQFASYLKQMTGVVDHGLFIDMATDLMIGMTDGTVKHYSK